MSENNKNLMGFKPVTPNVNFVDQEKKLLDKWYKNGIVEKYLHKNDKSTDKFSFLDGPITANNPMGVHHAWSRTYKDFWQRYWNMQGRRQRFQNGFDEQGLWVEVEVEKELNLHSKKEIENLVNGNKFASLEKFINLCKARVKKFSEIQTEQSKRLGYFMDWDNSYHTSSDENNYTIWGFLQKVNEKGWLYKGHDSVPWCPRCGTAISQMEILTEEYKEIYHESIYFKLPIKGKSEEFLMVWTTTPWTIPSNVAVAVNKKENYVLVQGKNDQKLWVMKKRMQIFNELNEPVSVLEEKLGKDLIGWEYVGPFDELPLVRQTFGDYKHRVIDGEDVVTDLEGTGLLHVAPGAGVEDFKLGKTNNLPVITSIEEDASYVDGMDQLSKKNAKKHPDLIIEFLKSKNEGMFLFATQNYKHRYPTCWRCKSELVWRVVDEWYIAMDKKDDSGKTYREQMIEVAKQIAWMPSWGLERELDWLKNMQDWLISKKRYWGLTLPIWECKKCGHFDLIGSRQQLKERAVEGFDKFDGNSPHRPWIDEVKIKCSKCGEKSSRIPDVGNPWLDAGIVPFSTMSSDWLPADFITESFPGQFKNWFYSLVAMSTAVQNETSFKRVLGFGSVRDEKGEEMHKSKGNSIEFNEAADKTEVDTMRWLYLRTNPEHNVNFGYGTLEEIRRLFLIKLWNVYSFFVTYANLNEWKSTENIDTFRPENTLDVWILSKMTGNIKKMTNFIEAYQADKAIEQAEIFINDLSNWYIRRSRERFSKNDNFRDKDQALQTIWLILTEYSKALAPSIPFVSDEIYVNLTSSDSVHLQDWPKINEKWLSKALEKEMEDGVLIASLIHALRKESGVAVRIPLRKINYFGPRKLSDEVEKIIKDEVNVYDLNFLNKKEQFEVENNFSVDNQDLDAGEARKLIRQIQQERKVLGTTLDEEIDVVLPDWPTEFEDEIKKKALIRNITKGEFKVTKI